ncbi:MAG: hypothetical protein JST53_12160 [Actinobacteria bacterium]|nr:hypothetical protein [Actinomycetota bacterium]
MVFALIFIIAIAIAFLASPLIALAVFILGFVAFLGLAGMKRTSEAGGNASSDPGAHAAQRFRDEGRNTPSH